MPVVIEWANFADEPSQSGPIVVCDHCDTRIDDARDGNAQWREPSSSPGHGRRDLFFTHKRCYRAFTADERPDSDFMWHSQELSAFLWFLTSNAAWNADEAEPLALAAAGIDA